MPISNSTLIRDYVDCKVNGNDIDWEITPNKVIKLLEEKKDDLNRYDKNIYYTFFKTIFEETNSVIMIFLLHMPTTKINSGNNHAPFFKLLEHIEKVFLPIDRFRYDIISGNKKDSSIGVFKVIKKIRETEDVI